METHRAENSEQKPSAFESPARLAGGAPRTSALGLGDTPSSHTSPCRSRGSADLGVVLPVLPLAVPTGRGWGPAGCWSDPEPQVGGKKKSERCPGPSPWKADPGPRLVSRSSRAWGRGKETSETRHLSPRKTSQAGELGRPARLLLLECVPTHSGGFPERLACEKEVRRGWGDVGRRRGTPGLERGSGCERPGSAASTRDSCRRGGGADVVRKLAGVCLCFGPRRSNSWLGF